MQTTPEIPQDTQIKKRDKTTTVEHLLYLIRKAWDLFVRFWRWAAYAIGSLFLFFLILVVVLSLLSGSYSDGVSSNERKLYGSGLDKIAVISIEGVIGEVGSSVLGGSVGVDAEVIRAELQQAKEDSAVKAVVLRINSPGGSAVVSDQIYQHIVNFRDESSKPVVAVLGDTAASGGYYVAAASDRIVANPATLTGSIGVIMEYFNAQGLLSNIGVDSEVIKSGKYKDIGSFSRETTDEERQILQRIIDGAHEQFVVRVSEGRDIEIDAVRAIADGRIYTGAQAKENGLVDELGNFDVGTDVAASLANISNPTVVEYQRGGWVDSLIGARSSILSLILQHDLSSMSNSSSGLQYRWMP